jgi:hypothetical protein
MFFSNAPEGVPGFALSFGSALQAEELAPHPAPLRHHG